MRHLEMTLVLAGVLAACGPTGDGADSDARSPDTVADVAGQKCSENAVLVQVAACMVRAEEPPGEPVYSIEHSAEGTVIETGTGMPPDNCFHNCNHIGDCLMEQSMSRDGTWVRVEDTEGVVWTAALVAPFQPSWPKPGDHVSLNYSFLDEPFAPDLGVLDVRKDGVLVVWLGVGGSPETLDAPDGLSFEKGEAVCGSSDECGAWSMYTMDVSLGDQEGTAGYRTAPLHIADYDVFNAGVAATTSHEQLCPDWFMADARVVVWANP